MPTVIIIGFQYDNTDKELKSTITDSYLIYSYYKKLNYKIYIGSDAISTKPSDKLIKLLINNIVDEEYFNFCISGFMGKKKNIQTRKDLLNFFNIIELTEDKKVIIYYTGHGETKGIKLPDKTILSAVDFRNAILKIGKISLTPHIEGESKKTIKLPTSYEEETNYEYKPVLSLKNGINSIGSQILILMDCCNPHGLYLPYKLDILKNNYIDQTLLHVPAEIILLTATDSNSSVIAEEDVSIFTRNFIDLLKNTDKNIDLPSIIKNISTNSNCYVSYTTTMLLWSWIYTNSINIEINEFLDCIVVIKQ